MSLLSINFLHLTVSEIYPRQDFIAQVHYSKVKGQIKVTPWHCTPTPPSQCPYQVSTSYTLHFPRYSPDKILKVKVTTARSKVKSRSDHDLAHLHPLTNNPTKYQLPTPYTFRDIARTRFYRARSKVKSRSDHDVAHLHPLTNIPTKYQLPTPYGFQDIAWTRFSNSRSLWQGQIKVRPWRCTPTSPNQCPYQVSTSYTLRFPRYSPDKLFPAAHPPGHHGWKLPPQPLRTVG